MIVAGDEGDGSVATSSRLAFDFEHRRHEPPEQQGGRRGVAVVHLVAHVQRLRHQRLELDPADLRQRHLRAVSRETLAIHFKRVDHLGAVGAEAQHLAEPLVEIAESQTPARRLAHDPYRHRRADDARHRADRAMMVAGLEREPRRSPPTLARFSTPSPSLRR